MGEISITKKIGNTDYNYKILTAGSKFKVPMGERVTIELNGKIYSGKMHSKTVGRIDGLGALYNENNIQIGDEVTLTYDEYQNRIFMEWESQWNSNVNMGNDSWANNEADYLEMEEKNAKKRKLGEIFSSFDDVAIHYEYYMNRYQNPQQTVANGNWIFYWANWKQKSYLMDINGNNKIELPLGKEFSYDLFLGMNKNGIWFMRASRRSSTWNDTDWFNEIVCVDIVNSTQRKIKMNRKKGDIFCCNTYIYDNNIYYVTQISENKQVLYEINSYGTERVLYATKKGEQINHVSADATRVAFEVTTKREGEIDCWYLVDLWSGQLTQLGAKRNPEYDWKPFIRIRQIYLHQNIIWTDMTEGEKMRFAIEDGWIARPLKELEEYSICVYKKDRSPVVYKIFDDSSLCYFDGMDAYYASHYSELRRRDKDGNRYKIQSPDGHGDTYTLIITKSYVIVNYDARDAVRLPRKFHATDLYGRDNPEAVLIFEERDHRL